jgi:hypothetical protein
MTRREFFSLAAAAVVPAISQTPLIVPVHLIMDGRVKWRPNQLRRFWSSMWPEAVRDFGRCGIRLESTLRTGEVERPPGREPIVTGLDPGVINLVITNQIPMEWDSGRALSGVAMRYRGYDLCMVALSHAHCHEVPLLSVNTCVHEILHVLLHDTFEKRPQGVPGQAREFRIDWYATRMWLFHDGAAIRKAAQSYVERLRSDVTPRT